MYIYLFFKKNPESNFLKYFSAFFSILAAVVGILFNDLSIILQDGFFQGYKMITCYVILSQVSDLFSSLLLLLLLKIVIFFVISREGLFLIFCNLTKHSGLFLDGLKTKQAKKNLKVTW